MMRRDGTARDVEAVVSNQTDRPSVAGYVANIRDITERKKFEALLAHRALHDPLTGLANRQLILDRAEQMLVRARRSGVPVAALFIDLDNFKDSNDSLGHGAGDKLLQMVAGRLLGILRSGDTVGRLGGDEFVILAEGVSFARGPEMIAERVHEVLGRPSTCRGSTACRSRCQRASGSPSAIARRPRISSATPTSPSTGPRGPAATSPSSSSTPCSRRRRNG